MAVTIREPEGFEELRACVDLQEEVWGEGFGERVGVSILRVTRRLGGIVLGAYDEDEGLVGFVFGLTGVADRQTVHWSDMLAVRSPWRDQGIGQRLKLAQRERCLDAGISTMYWTFDPLEARNAWLNLGRLGAVGCEYVRDMYGPSVSPLHRGLPTDRLVALWALESARVEERLHSSDRRQGTRDPSDLVRAFESDGAARLPEPGPPRDTGGAPSFLVPIPSSLQEVLSGSPELAEAWRFSVRGALEPALARGLEVRELIRGQGSVSYLLLSVSD